MAVKTQPVLLQRQWLARSHAQLPRHQVQAGDGLGDRVFHLQPGVHLHEEKITLGVEQKLQRTRALVADGPHCLHRHRAHALAQVSRHGR